MLESEPYDLIFMDCHMPLLDGYDAAREIRRREAADGRGHVPIVAMTADAMLGDRERCLAAGMDDYMAKPISLDALDEMLVRWLSPGGGDGVKPSPAGLGELDILDRVRLAELRELFPGDEMPDMLRALTAEVTTELERVDAALADADQAALASAAHRIKNSAHMIGARRLADAAAQLAPGAHADGPVAGSIDETAVAAMREQWSAVRSAIEVEAAHV
jgi:CheY-like chemotaxis protein